MPDNSHLPASARPQAQNHPAIILKRNDKFGSILIDKGDRFTKRWVRYEKQRKKDKRPHEVKTAARQDG
ncbi:hypothetical protein KIN20_021936 [Parelaphostrongylus tenuis]|uniref:Uncharacterized protein n=1 Tax=Parelaphostrongylus tenuis TaxID=148309 RepID=A0AAD5MPY4_PARTN|nr:hypothetical protein KIN20_021936 [Parelaphostrongylus tenuis]